MILEIILALLLGILAGTFTGISPGIHINLVSSLIVSSLPFLSFIHPITIAIFIVAMSITHTFLDFIPSIFIGAPEEDSFLSILPGHQLLLEGRGYEAFIITLYGSLAALIIIILLAPIFILILPFIYNATKLAIPFVLIFISLYIIFREENFLISLIVFLLSGFLGFLTFNLPIKEPLMPLLTGLFGLSSLFISIKSKSKIPKQEIAPLRSITLTKPELLKSLLAIFISSPFCSFLPGIGSSHSATIGSEIIQQTKKGFLFLVGATNTIIMGLSFITIYAIGKARSGTADAIKDILQTITLHDIVLIIITILLSGILASILGIILARFFVRYINKINYQYITLFTILILFIINLIFSNLLGILVLITATSLGIFAISSNSRRINLMGSLIVPAIVYYLFY